MTTTQTPTPDAQDLGIEIITRLVAPVVQGFKAHIPPGDRAVMYAAMMGSLHGLMVADLGLDTARAVLEIGHDKLLAHEFEGARLQ